MGTNPLRIIREFLELKSAQWQDRDAILSLQCKRLEALLRSAFRTPHYAAALAGLSQSELADDITSAPFTTKDEVLDRRRDFISSGATDLLRVETGGTGGVPLTFFRDKAFHEHCIARGLFLENEFGASPFDLQAYILARPVHSRFPLYPRISLSTFEPEDKNLETVKKRGVKILGGHTNSIAIMAGMNDGYRLKSVFATAETLRPRSRRLIEDSFSCRVFDHYAATEFHSLAWECPEEGSLHVNIESCLVEIIGRNGRPKKSGPGEVVVTGLRNLSMPLVRYRLGDLAQWGRDCPCGRGLPVLKAVLGRSSDTILLPSGRRRALEALGPLYRLRGIRAYQVIQERPDALAFRYVRSPDFSKATEERVREILSRGCLGEPVAVECEEVERLEKSRSGKIPDFISRIRPAGG
ncbi:MAG: hypothetical protein AB1529_00365 [Candidatus Micrarchaeota archaeon]